MRASGPFPMRKADVFPSPVSFSPDDFSGRGREKCHCRGISRIHFFLLLKSGLGISSRTGTDHGCSICTALKIALAADVVISHVLTASISHRME